MKHFPQSLSLIPLSGLENIRKNISVLKEKRPLPGAVIMWILEIVILYKTNIITPVWLYYRANTESVSDLEKKTKNIRYTAIRFIQWDED